ncbi:MarR family transcriptional regulator [Novosphingobium aquiterrae]|uniref:MarR family transcriptional regulator n=1 Tax=Novosphingobium aquiterrae TaxID=624388 RepID=A0ABV6PGI7_9SPHN
MSASSIGRTAAELREIAEKLLLIAAEKEKEIEPLEGWDPRSSDKCDPVYLARIIYKTRLERSSFFDEELLGEPGWDMLLDLFIARSVGREISVTSLCHAARVAQTTGLRWIVNLEAAGLIERVADPSDGRVKNVRMTTVAATRMHNYLTRHMSTYLAAPDLRLVKNRR